MPENDLHCVGCRKVVVDLITPVMEFGDQIRRSDLDLSPCDCGEKILVKRMFPLPADNSGQWEKARLGIKKAPKGKEAAKAAVAKATEIHRS